MADIFNSFSTGFTQGRQIRDDRIKRNALMEAGQAYQGGDYKGAANALFAQDPASALRIQEYGRGLESDKVAQADKAKADEQARAKATLTAFGQMAQALKPLPMEARLPAARQYVERLAPTLGMDPQQLLEMMNPNDFTDTNIDSTIALSMDPDAFAKLQQDAAKPQVLAPGAMLTNTRGDVLRENPRSFAQQGGGGGSVDGVYTRPMTPEEKAAWGYPAGAIVGVDPKGKPVVPQGSAKTVTETKASDMLRSAKDKALDVKESIAAARDLAKKSVQFGPIKVGTTGIGSLSAIMPGSPALDLQKQIDTIKSNIGFQELAEMRKNSPTGAALGSVTERELTFLQSVIASLDTSQSQEQFLQNLNRVERAYDRVLKALESDYARDFGGGQEPAQPSERSIDDLLKQYGQ